MILHMLGGGYAQLAAVKRCRELGLKTVVSDHTPDAPAFSYCDFQSRASTFDPGAVERDALTCSSDVLMTTGTDQPVLTAALVSEKLGLPYFLSSAQAEMVTNKKIMKHAFVNHDIPTARFRILSQDFHDEDLDELSFPLVIKPLDSQGQRGVMKVHSCNDIRQNFAALLSFSRKQEILAEEYYPSDELTVNGWAGKGEARILMITDRVTIDNGPHIGVCVSHRYPSLYAQKERELQVLTQKITRMIGIENGPLYFQILAGKGGFKVNEIACRLGGAYEDEFIPYMTGFPILDSMIELTRGGRQKIPEQQRIDHNLKGKYLSLQMFFASSGVLHRIEGMDAVRAIPGVLNAQFLLAPGTEIEERKNCLQRAGYFVVTGSSRKSVNRKIREAYHLLRMEDAQRQPMLQFYNRMLFPYE